jgi:hypothetical protein
MKNRDTKSAYVIKNNILHSILPKIIPTAPKIIWQPLANTVLYNNFVVPGKSPSLRQAMLAGNRAEAWYQIRYYTPDGN